MPHVLIRPSTLTFSKRAESVSAFSSSALIDSHRSPARAELATDPVDRGVLATQLLDRPPARPRCQLGPGCGNPLVLLNERADRTPRVRAHPAPLAPHDPDRPTHRRRIDQPHPDAAVAARADPARATTHRLRRRLDRDRQPVARIALDRDNVQPVQANEQVTTVAVAAQSTAAQRRLDPPRTQRATYFLADP